MDEKIILLMEETGCAQGEAQLALELANNNFEKAIHTVKSILRNIAVVKGRFYIEDKNLYGLFIAILDKRAENLIRLTSVVSYNPIVYETDLANDWHFIEKSIYNYRLIEGSVPSLTRDVELHFYNEIASKKDKLYKALVDGDKDKISEMLIENFPIEQTKLEINAEEINLAQYQQSEDNPESDDLGKGSIDSESKRLFIEAQLSEDPEGKKAKYLLQDEVVLAQIVDNREIARYLSKLLGEKDMEYIPVRVEEIELNNQEIIARLHFSPGIAGYARIKPQTRVKVVKEIQKPLWKKIFGLR
ncbi:MAG: hypothetical protein KKH91_08075 [Elusimicrobia bacterium]|nr:hypothetical protein [Elusimicrobiota bacterium]MBU2614389.1 hypothetical protein [Elusimicrobiota bacterium]